MGTGTKRTNIGVCVRLLAGVILAEAVQSSAGRTWVVDRQGADGIATIAAGVARLRPGDALEIPAGVYHEAIDIHCDDVAIVAAERGVVLDGACRVPATQWQPAPERRRVFVWRLPQDAPSLIPWVFLGNDPLLFRSKPLDTVEDEMCFFLNKAEGTLEVNVGVERMDDGTPVFVPVIRSLLKLNGHRGVTVRGLHVLRAADCAVDAGGSEGLHLEYCIVERAGGDGINGGNRAVYARNTIMLCNANAIYHGGDGTVVEQSLLVANNVSWNPGERWSGNVKLNHGCNGTYRQNWILDHVAGPVQVGPHKKSFTHFRSTGVWLGLDSFNNTFEGNAVARMPYAGFLVEHLASRNVFLFNTVQDCAMGYAFRGSSANLAVRNWVWDRFRLGWGDVALDRYAGYVTTSGGNQGAGADGELLRGVCFLETPPIQTRENCLIGNLMQVSGPAVNVVPGEAGDGRPAAAAGLGGGMLSNHLNANRYERRGEEGVFAVLGGEAPASFEEYRARTGWDASARTGRFDLSVLGGLAPLWTTPWAALAPGVPVAMLYDPALDTPSCLDSREPLFWHGSHVKPNWANSPPVSRYDESGRGGGRCLLLWNTQKRARRSLDEMPSWTSSAVPVHPGTQMGAGFWVRAEEVSPADAGDGLLAAMVFVSADGFRVGDCLLVGKETRVQLRSGTYDWQQVEGVADVPAGAAWMTVFFALDPGEGRVWLDDIEIGLRKPRPPAFEAP